MPEFTPLPNSYATKCGITSGRKSWILVPMSNFFMSSKETVGVISRCLRIITEDG